MRNSTLFAVFVLLLTIPKVVSANSSWCWISETRPYDILPIVAIATILIEVCIINRCVNTKKTYKTIVYVLGANLASFLCPYVVNYCKLIDVKGYQPMREMFEHWPVYTVGIYFLIMTIVIEVPIVYLGLFRQADDSRNLKKLIIVANITTTIMVAVVERILCQGRW